MVEETALYVGRYTGVRLGSTHLNPFDDFVGWVEGLRSKSYVEDIIAEKHTSDISASPRVLARQVVPYVEAALGFIEQSDAGPSDLAFLPSYYAILNLSKVYILLGRLAPNMVGKNLNHGVNYRPEWKQTLATNRQYVQIHKDGIAGLLYRTLTRGAWVSRATKLSMNHVYPFLPNVGLECNSILNLKYKLTHGAISAVKLRNGLWTLRISLDPDFDLNKFRQLHPLNSEHWMIDESRAFSLRARSEVPHSEIGNLVKDSLRRNILHQDEYDTSEQMEFYFFPYGNNIVLMPEEFSLFIAFFYQSSIARYKPDFLKRELDSHLWPFLVAMKRHGLFAMLKAFWSFMMQESYYLTVR